MVQVGDVVYIKDESPYEGDAKQKKWTFKVTSIVKNKAKLEWLHPQFLERPPLTLGVDEVAPVTLPKIGDTVTVKSNRVPSIYGDMTSNIGKVGKVKRYGKAKKSAIIEFEDGTTMKVHFADLGYTIPKQNPRKSVSSFSECPAKLIAEKEEVQKCITFDIGNIYYSGEWEDKSLVPRQEIEGCVQKVFDTADIAKQCYAMSPSDVKEELKQRHEWLKRRVDRAKKEFHSKPRKFCAGKHVIKFHDINDVSRFTLVGDAEAGGDGKAYSLNMITNDMHVMGLAMQKVSGRHCKCKLTDFASLNPYHYAYCEGAGGHATQKGTSIHHKLGIHHVQINLIENAEKGADVTVHYSDSVGYKGSKARMKSIMKLMKSKHGMTCKVVDKASNVIHCEGTLSDPKEAKTLGLFFTGTLDADIKTSKQGIMDKNLTKLYHVSKEMAEKSGCQKAKMAKSMWED